jgi:hypothetical protein
MSSLCGFQDQPVAFKVFVFIMFPQSGDDLIGNLLKIGQSKGQDGGAGTRETYTKESRLGLGRHGFDNLAQARDESLAVRLVDFVLHSQINELWVGR